MEQMHVPVLEECSVCLHKASARWGCHCGSQPRTGSRAGTTERRQREMMLQLLRLAWKCRAISSWDWLFCSVAWFVFVSMTCLTLLGLCPNTWSRQVGIPVANNVCLCIYSRKGLTLDEQGYFLFCCCFFTSGMFDISSGSFLLTPDWSKGNKHLAYRTCSFARYRGALTLMTHLSAKAWESL